MAFFYSDTSVNAGGPVNVWKMDGTKAYLGHFSNLLMLNFFARNGTFAERQAAEKEMVICERKLKFWEKHPNTDADAIQKGKAALIREWRAPR